MKNKYEVTWKSGKKEYPNLPNDWFPITSHVFIDAESKEQAKRIAIQKYNATCPKIRAYED